MSQLPGEATLRRMVAQLTPVAVSRFDQLGTSVANDVFRTDLADGTCLVVRVLRNQTPAGVEREIVLQRALLAAGIRTPRHLPLASGAIVGYESGHAFTIAEYLPGTSRGAMTPSLAKDFGRTLARFHQATEGIELDHHDWLHPTFVHSELDKLSAADWPRFENLLAGTQTLFTTGLPKANVHGDFYLANVHVADDRITAVFDLETTEYTVRLLDIAQSGTNVAVAAMVEPIPATTLVLDGYAEVATVTPAERAAVPIALRYSATTQALWLHNRGFPHAKVFLDLAMKVYP